MKICAALCWYDETPDFLTRCVSSLEGLVDSVLAVDGAWELFDGRAWSPDEQQWAIKTAAFKADIGCEVIVPPQRWRSQVEKRAKAMAAAGADSDWVFVIDADEYVALSADAEVRAALERTDCNTATVTIMNLHLGEVMPGYHPRGGLTRRFYRAGTTVTTVHSGYAFDGRDMLRDEPEEDLREFMLVEHDNHNRGNERNAMDRSYREARQREGVEVWV